MTMPGEIRLTPFGSNARKFFVLKEPLVTQPQAPQPVSMAPVVVGTPPLPPAQDIPSADPSITPPPTDVPAGCQPVPDSPQLVSMPGVDSPVQVMEVPVANDPIAVTPQAEETPVDLFALLIGQATDIKIVRYPRYCTETLAYLDIYLLVVTEIYAVVHCSAIGLLRGDLNLDQIKLLVTNGSIQIANDISGELRLVYKDDQTQQLSVTGQCPDGQTLIENTHRFAACYQEELEAAVQDNQQSRLYRRFIEVLMKEATAVREWLTSFPVGMLK